MSGRSYDWRQITYDFKASEGFGKAELSSQNIEASNTKNDGKLIFKENRNNSYYNYMYADYSINMLDLVRHFNVIKDRIYHLPDYW